MSTRTWFTRRSKYQPTIARPYGELIIAEGVPPKGHAAGSVRIVGTEQAVRDAIARPAQRASGLAERLKTSGPTGG